MRRREGSVNGCASFFMANVVELFKNDGLDCDSTLQEKRWTFLHRFFLFILTFRIFSTTERYCVYKYIHVFIFFS